MKNKLESTLIAPNRLIIISLLLLAAGMLVYSQLKRAKEDDTFATEIANSLQREIDKTKAHFDRVRPVATNTSVLFKKEVLFPYPFYIFENGRLEYWSDFTFTPNARDILGESPIRVAEKKESFYLLVKYAADQKHEVVYAIPLLIKYPIVNEYLKNTANAQVFVSENFEISLDNNEGFLPVSLSSESAPLFYLKTQGNYSSFGVWEYFAFNALFVLSILFFIAYLWRACSMQVARFRHGKALLIVIGGGLLLRFVMIFFNYPFAVLPVELFNPRNYASSFMNPSLGDLLFNVLFAFGIAAFIFVYYPKIRLFRWLMRPTAGTATFVCLVFIHYLLLSLFFLMFNSLNTHSQWTLDISRELNFHLLKIISYVIVMVGGVAYFLLSHVIFRIILNKYKGQWKTAWTVYLLGTLLSVIVSALSGWDFLIITIITTFYFLVLYLFDFPRYVRKIQYLSFVYFFVASLPLCMVGAYSIYRYQVKSLLLEKERLTGQLLVDRDVLTEYLLQEASERIANDIFIQNRVINPYVSRINIKQRIQRVYLNNQLEKYDVTVRLFNSRGVPIDESATSLKDILENHEESRIDSTLYFIDRQEANALKRYLKIIEVKRYSRLAGYVLIDLKLKRIIPNTVYPLLLVDNRFSGPDIGMEYSYGIYENGRLIFNSGSYNYPYLISGNFDLEKTSRIKGYRSEGMVHFSEEGDSGKTFLISMKAYPIQNIFSNFSFLFILFLGNILLALALITLYFKIKGFQLNYAARIQLFLNAAFLTPLMIISVSAVSVIVKSYNENLELENLQRASNISNRISEVLDDHLKRAIGRGRLFNEINDISRFTETDINVFATNGRLLTSSQPLIYENELLAEVINPVAFGAIYHRNEGGMTLEEHLGKLAYRNTYMPIKSQESGQLIGVLSLPYFDVRKKLEENVIDVLTNVLNIFTIIFIVFIVLSYLASSWLTFPLRMITQKIKKTSLMNTNEPLEWNSNDEIGMMVGEYNKMLLNLEESKKALARSEKESAWREIARQVAHEIKNPLTPMKLTLQHMRRTLEEGQVDKQKRITQIDALLHQINTLSDIATSFSTFAKMPVPQNERFELSELLNETIALYEKDSQVLIPSAIEKGLYWVDGDRKWIGQAISNIIINGIQATEGQDHRTVSVKMQPRGKHKCRLSVSDNGPGIPKEIESKIFIPNFSTKEKGSGIGLAIAKRAIEHAKGDIWFETEPRKGTTFYIEMPLMA